MKRRVHSRELKLEVARQVVNGEKRPTQVCREHNLSNSVLDRWRKAYEQRAEAAFTEKEVTEQPISQICETLQVSRSWYSEKQTRPEANEADVELRDAIEGIILEFAGS